jgi:hypothetical protein
MVPKINAKREHFRGTAQYLLHDIGAKTANRVAWTEIRNVASRNPQVAWKVMAATAMDQQRLKQQAGIKNTGRKSSHHALHFSLAWHPEERDKLTRQEMMRAAITILKVMGAEQHQALIVAHNDGAAPHCHVLVNRVNPQDGRILSSSFEKLKASRWAEEYEKARGKIYCEERVLNNEARDRGEFLRGEKDDPRHLHEALEATKDQEQKRLLKEHHRRWAHALKEQERRLIARRDQAIKSLEQDFLDRSKRLGPKAKASLARAVKDIRDRYRPQWKTQLQAHRNELQEFDRHESGALGRIHNTFKSIDLAAMIRLRKPIEDGRAQTLTTAFQMLSSTGARKSVMEQRHKLEKNALAAQQRREEKQAKALYSKRLKQARMAIRQKFLLARNDALFSAAMDTAKLKAAWREKGRKMRGDIETLRQINALNRGSEIKGPAASLAKTIPSMDQEALNKLSDKVQEIGEMLKQRRGRHIGRGR